MCEEGEELSVSVINCAEPLQENICLYTLKKTEGKFLVFLNFNKLFLKHESRRREEHEAQQLRRRVLRPV